jgi:hypothetical protein
MMELQPQKHPVLASGFLVQVRVIKLLNEEVVQCLELGRRGLDSWQPSATAALMLSFGIAYSCHHA